jgi:hypothetical protein
MRYRQLFEELASTKDSGKQIENALVLLCWFYTFKVVSSCCLYIYNLYLRRAAVRLASIYTLAQNKSFSAMHSLGTAFIINFSLLASQSLPACKFEWLC